MGEDFLVVTMRITMVCATVYAGTYVPIFINRRRTEGHVSRPSMCVPGYTAFTSQTAHSKSLVSLKARNLLTRDVTVLTSQQRFCTREQWCTEGGFGVFKPPPPKFRRYRWSPRSHEQDEPASRFPFVVHCVLIRL